MICCFFLQGHRRLGLGPGSGGWHATALPARVFGRALGTSTASAANYCRRPDARDAVKQGYEPKMARLALVAIQGTLAMTDSAVGAIVIMGCWRKVISAALLIGGSIPGILVTLTIMATVGFSHGRSVPARRRPAGGVPFEKIRI